MCGPFCGDGRWSLVSAPGGNANEVVAGADGRARFSPIVPGRYTFRSGDVTETFSLAGIGRRTSFIALRRLARG